MVQWWRMEDKFDRKHLGTSRVNRLEIEHGSIVNYDIYFEIK